MTNGEKYLKEGVDTEEFIKELHIFWWLNEYDVCEGIRKFLSAEAKKKKPTLTEDERVILRNINKKYNYIGRHEDSIFIDAGKLYVSIRAGAHGWSSLPCDHLFQFIKNGEEYSIEELLKGE